MVIKPTSMARKLKTTEAVVIPPRRGEVEKDHSSLGFPQSFLRRWRTSRNEITTKSTKAVVVPPGRGLVFI